MAQYLDPDVAPTILATAYLAGGLPIRLQSADSERVTAADPRSPLGFNTYNNSLVIALRADGTGLSGEDERYRYTFVAAADDEGGR